MSISEVSIGVNCNKMGKFIHFFFEFGVNFFIFRRRFSGIFPKCSVSKHGFSNFQNFFRLYFLFDASKPDFWVWMEECPLKFQSFQSYNDMYDFKHFDSRCDNTGEYKLIKFCLHDELIWGNISLESVDFLISLYFLFWPILTTKSETCLTRAPG